VFLRRFSEMQYPTDGRDNDEEEEEEEEEITVFLAQCTLRRPYILNIGLSSFEQAATKYTLQY
jgi:hypothetical protein